MRYRSRVAVGAAMILVGCGGGSVNSTPAPVTPSPTPAPTPTPTPTPTPMPAPTPTPTPPPTLPPTTSGTLADAYKSDQDFRTGSAEVIATPDLFQTRNGLYSASSGLRLYYDAATSTYTVSNATGAPFDFGMGNESGSNTSFRQFGINQTDGVRRLRVLRTGASNPTLALSYASYGVWEYDAHYGSGPDGNDRTFFYFGVPTAAEDMPRTGGGNYSGVAEGRLYDGPRKFDLRGTVSLLADFAQATLSTGLDLTEYNTNGSIPPIALERITGTASITASSNQFDGTLATVSNGYVGSFRGAFFGPQADEFGYSFAINSPDLTRLGVGVAVGKK